MRVWYTGTEINGGGNTVKVIVGLGNPGTEYENTRHNIGFMILDKMAEAWGWTFRPETSFFADVAQGNIAGEKVVLLKPMTYMNESGRSVAAFTRYFKVDEEDVMVISDDLDLTVGNVRLREKGSAGGHNGLKSIMNRTQWQHFKRVRMGIGRPPKGCTVVDHVLGRFTKDEMVLMNPSIDLAVDAVEDWIDTDNFVHTMNQFNKKGA